MELYDYATVFSPDLIRLSIILLHTHGRWYTDCLLENDNTKHNKYAVNQNLSNILMIVFSEFFWSHYDV